MHARWIAAVAMIGTALALTALGAVMATTAAARPATDARQVKPGLSDFGLTGTQIALASAPVTDARQVQPGLSDFGRSADQLGSAPASIKHSTRPIVVSSSGFDWVDAGVGAAAMLGIVLLVGGLGAAVVLRSHRGEFGSA
jgi:hypothetical protein